MRSTYIQVPTCSHQVMSNNEGLTIALVFRRSRISVLKFRNSKDTTMPRQYFRLKVNLSKFFHDARRICWIFIDLTKIQHITHIKQHITKIFGINEPFHLLLNDTEYLPPMEDVRILLENEIIKVVPGSGIHNESATLTVLSNIDNYKHISKTETSNDTAHEKISQVPDIKIDKIKTNSCNNRLNISNDVMISTLNDSDPVTIFNNTADMMFTTAIGDTEANTEVDVDSKITDCGNLTEIKNTTDSATKKKRIRKRKSKNKDQNKFDNKNSPLEISSSDTKEEDKSKKPKIVDDYIIPTGKHIRFNDTEEEYINHVPEQIVNEVSNDKMEFYTNRSVSKNLSTLLALRQSSTPITFTKKIKDTNKIENFPTPMVSVVKDIDMESPIEEKARCTKNLKKINNENGVEKNICTKEDNKKTQLYKNLLNFELENFSVMSRKPRVGDVIAFKILKLANDYTPQVSNVIIGEILSSCVDSANYTFKIIKGLEEIVVPSGKFSLYEENESACQDDKVSFNFSQIIEPRLIIYSNLP